MELPQPEDAFDERMLEHIRRLGWGVVHVPEDEEGPGFSFSVGFYYSWQHPELFIMGLEPEKAHAILAIAAENIGEGRHYEEGRSTEDFLSGYSCHLRGIPREKYPDFLGYARWLYRGDDFPALQALWPDRAGRFPGQADFAAPTLQYSLEAGQPWPFDQPPNACAFTTRHVLEGAWIHHVTHDFEDAGWQFHARHEHASKPSDGAIVSMASMLLLDSTLAQLGDLPPGWCATRESPDAPWQRRPDFPNSDN